MLVKHYKSKAVKLVVSVSCLCMFQLLLAIFQMQGSTNATNTITKRYGILSYD